jgi:hypothetical protein
MENEAGERPVDIEKKMLFGCSGFVLTAIGGFAISVWPFIVFSGLERTAVLAECALFGLLPAAILGCLSTRRFGIPGACGMVGCAMAVDVFLYLRFQEISLGVQAQRIPEPDYPANIAWLAPLAWILASLFLAILSLPKSELSD